MNYKEYCQRLYELLALEYNCSASAFTGAENILTESVLREGRRMYGSSAPFFSMVTTGRNAVITADPGLHPFLAEFIREKQGHWLFELPNLLPLEKELNGRGFTLSQSFHMFLPKLRVEPRTDFTVKWYGEEALRCFYGDPRFSNAFCESPRRPDRLAVAAFQ